MTITTAKLPRKALRLTPLALAALLLSAECRADWKFTPTIGVAETYSDNPGLQRDEDAHGQWIAETTPGFTLTTHSRRLRLNASGEWHFYKYQDKNTPNTHDRERRYAAAAEANLIENLLTLEANANGSNQAVSAFGPRFAEPYSTFNRTDVQTWSISPVVQHRFGTTAELQMRLTRDSVRSNGDIVTDAAFGNSKATTALFTLGSPAKSGNPLGWALQYMRQNLETERFGTSTSTNASGTLSYRLNGTLSAVGTVGHDSYEYTTLNNRTAGPSYSGGFIWVPTSRTSIDARIGHSYLGRTGSLMAVQRNRHLVSQVTYTDQVTTTRAQFLLPASIDTVSMLDRLLSATISDPVARAQAVQAYIAATGLPPSLTDNVNYLSNRYMRDKRLQAAFIYNLQHSTLTAAVYRSERTGLSLQQSDSELLGSQLSSLNDNVRQVGVNAGFNYRLSARTTANALASAVRSTSLTTGIMTPSHYLSVGLTRQFNRNLRLNVELRHSQSANGAFAPSTTTTATTATGLGSYTENAVKATLSVQL
jgi:uncharacterized protein (PEP-CTERM system associated)